MALATWWRGDTVPALSLLPGFRVEASRDEHLIAHINQLAPSEVRQRMGTGHTTAAPSLGDRPLTVRTSVAAVV